MSDGENEPPNASTAGECGDLRTACARTGTRDNDAIGCLLGAARLEWLASRNARQLVAALNQIVERLRSVDDSPHHRQVVDSADRSVQTRRR